MSRILVLAEHDGHKLAASVHRVVGAAQHLVAPVDLLVVGHALDGVIDEARRVAGVARICVVEAPHLAAAQAEDLAALLVRLAPDYDTILAAHSAFSRNALPRAAALLGVDMLSDVLELRGGGVYVRPLYAGNLVATVRSEEPIQILTVRASRFAPAEGVPAAEIVRVPAGTPDGRVRRVAVHHGGGGPDLGSAHVVVSGGRCLGSAERFAQVLAPLADVLGAALGATRAAVDAGYAPNDIQVGQTGVIVAPDLYIAVGISGAVQHTAGMKDSRVVVAINQDPEAAIFEVADYGLVADLFSAVPELTAALRGALADTSPGVSS